MLLLTSGRRRVDRRRKQTFDYSGARTLYTVFTMSTFARFVLASAHRHNIIRATFLPNSSALNQRCKINRKPKWSRVPPYRSDNQRRLFSNEKQTEEAKLDVTNPTLEWKGASKSSSGFVCHFVAPSDGVGNPSTRITSVVEAVVHCLREKSNEVKLLPSELAGEFMEFVFAPNAQQAARDLIRIGAIWFLPASASRDPSHGIKPRRLSIEQADMMVLEPHDYLRIHFHPRRFPVHDFDWNATYSESRGSSSENSKPGVIVAENASKGWIVINKPSGVPVHMTVDNARENVQACIYHARCGSSTNDGDGEKLYIGSPQRLDQNTSGLVVVATSKRFSAYFASLLRTKTAAHQQMNKKEKDNHEHEGHHNETITGAENAGGTRTGGVHKIYKCLVCLLPPNEYARNASLNRWTIASPPLLTSLSHNKEDWSVAYAMQELTDSRNNVVRHWLEPSIKAPKRYFTLAPKQPTKEENKRGANMWLESLLKITRVGTPLPLVGNSASETLARKLWSGGGNSDFDQKERIPKGCQAVVELEIELLTGRTHQIRGQLAAMGFPLVGDVQYGGATPVEAVPNKYRDSERLALQCTRLEFLEPVDGVVEVEDGSTHRRRSKANAADVDPPFVSSDRWNRFELKRAWWSNFVEQYEQDVTDERDDTATISSQDPAFSNNKSTIEKDKNQIVQKGPRPDLLPHRVQLSAGRNKYVLVRAFLPPGSTKANDNDPANYWFVKSASPEESGGPYHGNVARELREWIEACGFEVHVTGGGRIDYDPLQNRCVVYGFSYGFGKGNHEWAAKVIRNTTGMPATFDNDDSLY